MIVAIFTVGRWREGHAKSFRHLFLAMFVHGSLEVSIRYVVEEDIRIKVTI